MDGVVSPILPAASVNQGGFLMKIADSSIQFASAHTLSHHHERQESLITWQQGEGVQEKHASGKAGAKDLQIQAMELQKRADTVSLSSASRVKRSDIASAEPVLEKNTEVMSSLNMRILEAFFEKVTGKKIHFSHLDQLAEPVDAGQQPQPDSPEQVDQPPESVGWGLDYQYRESYSEAESTSFSAQGLVQTADGRQIDISVSLNMSREFIQEKQLTIKAGDALKDPLVIQFDGKAAALTQETFSFDIDADGQKDQIAFVAPGSGFLALDKNGDQQINDGKELFGTQSGNGFAELAAYDQDENGWIDENDAVYDRLRIWSKDQEGNDQLLALGQQGIGALYLGHVDTPFSLKDTENNLQGQVVASSIFLHEDGRVGTLQQLDLVA